MLLLLLSLLLLLVLLQLLLNRTMSLRTTWYDRDDRYADQRRRLADGFLQSVAVEQNQVTQIPGVMFRIRYG